MNKIAIILLGMLTVMTGCMSTGGTPIVREDIPALGAGTGRVIFYRTSMMFGSGMQPPIFLNGKKVGVSSSGTAFHVDTVPGRQSVSVAKIMYSGAEGGVAFDLHANEIIYVRTWTGGGSLVGRTAAGVMDPDTAEEHLKTVEFLSFNFEK